MRLTVLVDPPVPATASTLVAVTPAAVDAVAATGARPVVPDDLVDRHAAFARLDDLRWQIDWFERLDAALDAGGAVVASAQKFKVVVDSVVVASRLAAAAVDTLEPESLELVAAPRTTSGDLRGREHLQFWQSLGDASLWAEVLPLLAEARGLPLDVVDGDASATHAAQSIPVAPPTWRDRVRSDVARRTGRLRHFDLAHWRPGGSEAVVLLWDGGYGARCIVGAARRAGKRVLLLERSGDELRIVEPTPWGRRVVASRHPRRSGTSNQPQAAALAGLLAEIDQHAGIPGASTLLRTRFEAFVDTIVPEVAARSSTAEDLLAAVVRDTPIDAVVVANPSTPDEFAGLLAAGRAGIERQLAQHGDHLFRYEPWFVTEFPEIDTLLTSDDTLVADVPEIATALARPAPRVVPSAHRRRLTAAPPADAPICYVPAVLMGDTATLPFIYFDDAWYHRWHRTLLDWMRSRPDTRFIWKALPSGDHVRDPIVEAVNATPNVDYVTTAFPWILDRVGRVFTDFPSTPAYEARDAGRDLLILWFDRLVELRPLATESFGTAVRACADESVALDALDAWLSPPVR